MEDNTKDKCSEKRKFRCNKSKIFTALSFMLCTIFIICIASYFNLKNVTVIKDGVTISFLTYSNRVGYALQSSGISYSEQDYINMDLNSRLSRKSNIIYIKTAVPITVEADGTKNVYYSYKNYVKEALHDINIGYVEDDRIEGALLTDLLRGGMDIKLIRIRKNTEKNIEPISKGISVVNNYFLAHGTENILNPGEDGSVERVYNITTEDGIVKSKNVVKENILKAPVDMVIERGCANTLFTNRGDSIRYSAVYDMVATCYTLSYDECGKYEWDPGYGITASGLPAGRGVIAVNPNEIPYGTRLYIETADGSGLADYGYAVAGDTGYLRPNSIDLFVEDKSEALFWGIRPVRVYILLN